MKKQPAKIGRPPGRKVYDPQRQLGRVSDDDWNEIKQGAADCDMSVSQWAISALLRLARGYKLVPPDPK